MMFASPFECDPKCVPTVIQLELIELQESSELKSAFRDLSLEKLYSSLQLQLTQPCASMLTEWCLSLVALTYVKDVFRNELQQVKMADNAN